MPEKDRALPVSIHGAVITVIGGSSPVLWGLFMKGENNATQVNMGAFEVFFGVLLVSAGGMFWLR